LSIEGEVLATEVDEELVLGVEILAIEADEELVLRVEVLAEESDVLAIHVEIVGIGGLLVEVEILFPLTTKFREVFGTAEERD